MSARAERRPARVAAYRKRQLEREYLNKRKLDEPARIRSTKPSKPSIAKRFGKHSDLHIDRLRIAGAVKEKTKRRKKNARASRRGNR